MASAKIPAGTKLYQLIGSDLVLPARKHSRGYTVYYGFVLASGSSKGELVDARRFERLYRLAEPPKNIAPKTARRP